MQAAAVALKRALLADHMATITRLNMSLLCLPATTTIARRRVGVDGLLMGGWLRGKTFD